MASTTSPAFLDHFATLPDPRIERSKLHHLVDIVFIAVCATIAGANGFVGMEEFGHDKKEWLQRFLELPHGIPSHDTFGRVLAALRPEAFLQCFLSWVEALAETTQGQVVCIDGKTARASLDRSQGKNPLHVVTAWATANQLVLGQVAVDEKSNEITAIPRLLALLELHGAIVTIDAMGCQQDIVAQIREQGADYVVAVKGNQEHLEEDIQNHFLDCDEGRRSPRGRSVYEEKDKGHGREECRHYEAMPVPKALRHRERWRDLHSIVRVTRTWQERGEDKSEVRYFASSLRPDAQLVAQPIRAHWGIENGLHWVLDMYFQEDRSRARIDNAAENLALLRRWVLSLLRRDKTLKGGTETRRLKAAWNESNLEKLLGLR